MIAMAEAGIARGLQEIGTAEREAAMVADAGIFKDVEATSTTAATVRRA
jgi:hypothetical protein